MQDVEVAGHVALDQLRGETAGEHRHQPCRRRVPGPVRGDLVQADRPALEPRVGLDHVSVGEHGDPLGAVAVGERAEEPAHVRLRPADPAGEKRKQREPDVHQAGRRKQKTPSA
jgi:hypothetical protein